MLEAAFVTPVFFLMIFGILEVGLAMNDYLALSSTVRAGSRAASASGNDTKADLYTVLGISRESTAINQDNIVRIVVYTPDGFGDEPTENCKAGIATDDICNVYDVDDFEAAVIQVEEETEALDEGRAVDTSKITFGCGPTAPDRFWCPTDRNVRLSNADIAGYDGPDYVGVWMRIEHPSVTRIFPALTFEDHSVIRLEPRSE